MSEFLDQLRDKKIYLGDSVYAEFDGYHIILTTWNGLIDDPSNRIALEPAVLDALKNFEIYVNNQIELYNKERIKNERKN